MDPSCAPPSQLVLGRRGCSTTFWPRLRSSTSTFHHSSWVRWSDTASRLEEVRGEATLCRLTYDMNSRWLLVVASMVLPNLDVGYNQVSFYLTQCLLEEQEGISEQELVATSPPPPRSVTSTSTTADVPSEALPPGGVTNDPELMDLLALRGTGMRKKASKAPLPADGSAARRRAAQLATNALGRALRPIAERQVLQQR